MGGYPLYDDSLAHENNINKLSKIMFRLINMADYYCTFNNIDDILCQIKSILAVRFCILLIAKSGNETWCHDKYRLEGALCFPSPYTHKASVSSIYKPLHEWIRSLELQIVGGSFGHLCFSTMEPLEAEPSCCLELRSLHAVLYSWCVRWIHRRQASPMNGPPLYNNETPAPQLNSCRCIAHIGTRT